MIIFQDPTSPAGVTNVSSSKPLPVTIIGGGTGDVDGPASSTDNAIVRFDGTTGKLLQNSVNILSDVGDLALPSTATAGLQLYNTADQVTNYERGLIYWNTNTFRIESAQGGSGTLRNLAIVVGAVVNTCRGAGSASGLWEYNANGTTYSTAGGIGARFTGFTSTATSGTNIGLSLTPTYNQASGTAANTDLLVNRTQTAVGSGAQLLADFQVGAASQWRVSNNGTVTQAGALITTPQALSGAGAVNLTTSATEYTSTGAAQALTLANGTVGQHKVIVHTVDGGSGVLTPTTKIGFTTITFTNVGDSVTLIYTTTGWAIVGIFGAVAA